MYRCAQVGQLSGGKRDTTPPKLLTAIPKSTSVNFTGKQIELTFDEFVQVKDAANQVVITPQTKELPNIEAKGKKILIEFKEDLKSNTTYHIFFGNSIADMHEGNLMSNFEYVFSTGPFIDSLFITGKLTNAFSTVPEKAVTVGLYEENEADSVLFNKKPLYFTKGDGDGNYKISYLPKQKFKAYAFTDKNKNGLYDGDAEMAGFKNSMIESGQDTVVNFKLFNEISSKKFIKRSYTLYYGLAYVVYNKELFNKAEAFYKEQNSFIISEPGNNDTCTIYYHELYDTLKLKISHGALNDADTVKIPIMSEEVWEKQKGKTKLDIYLDPIENGKIAWFLKPVLVFNRRIDSSKMDISKIKLISKSDSTIDPKPLFSTAGLNKMILNNKLAQNTEYEILMDKGAFTDKNGIKNDSTGLSFKTSSGEDYGTLNLKLFFPKKENYVVQLVTLNGKIVAEQFIQLSLTSSSEQLLKFKNMMPGQYFVKVIEDTNRDKTWNTGNIMLKKQPETIYFNAQAVKILADWDAESEWKISAKE